MIWKGKEGIGESRCALFPLHESSMFLSLFPHNQRLAHWLTLFLSLSILIHINLIIIIRLSSLSFTLHNLKHTTRINCDADEPTTFHIITKDRKRREGGRKPRHHLHPNLSCQTNTARYTHLTITPMCHITSSHFSSSWLDSNLISIRNKKLTFSIRKHFCYQTRRYCKGKLIFCCLSSFYESRSRSKKSFSKVFFICSQNCTYCDMEVERGGGKMSLKKRELFLGWTVCFKAIFVLSGCRRWCFSFLSESEGHEWWRKILLHPKKQRKVREKIGLERERRAKQRVWEERKWWLWSLWAVI